MIRVSSVRRVEGFVLEIGFTDGLVRPIDVEPYLVGPLFAPLRIDPALFAAVRIDAALGTIVRPTGADICPDVLREGRRPASWDGHATAAPSPA